MGLLEKIKAKQAEQEKRGRFPLIDIETLEVQPHECNYVDMAIHPGLDERKVERCHMCGYFPSPVKKVKVRRRKVADNKMRTSWDD